VDGPARRVGTAKRPLDVVCYSGWQQGWAVVRGLLSSEDGVMVAAGRPSVNLSPFGEFVVAGSAAKALAVKNALELYGQQLRRSA
jgi:hypothetical protein